MRCTFATVMTAISLGQSVPAQETEVQTGHPYSGMWITDDGRVRHELFPTGRYGEPARL